MDQVDNCPCYTCKYLPQCEEHFGRIGVDEEDCRAIVGTHFCMGSWQKFIDDGKKMHESRDV